MNKYSALLLVALTILAFMQSTGVSASTGRKLMQAGDRPGRDYAQSVSLQATHAAMERMMVDGGRQNSIQQTAQLALKNAQTSTKMWPNGKRYSDGVKLAMDGDGDGDKDK